MDGFIKAPLGKRLSAFIIDLILICFLQNMVVGILILLLLDFDFTDLEAKSGVLLQGILIGTPITFLIFCFKDIYKGISLGKKIAKIAVRDENDLHKTPEASRLVLRNILLIIWPVELMVLVLSGAKGKRLGDRLLQTEVISKSPDPPG